jgi:FkbM family methyltransferase
MTDPGARPPAAPTSAELLAALERSVAAAGRRHPVRGLARRLRSRRGGGPRPLDVELFSGDRLRVLVPEIVGDALARDGHIEPAVTRAVLRWLRPGSVFVDVGAHYGYFSRLAERVVQPGGTVVAFEPARGTCEVLRRNLGGRPGVRIEDVALGEEDGVLALRDYGPGHSALNTVLGGARVPPDERDGLHGETYDVGVTSLDAYTERTGLVPDVVKLDAEGAELAILRGMAGLLATAAPKLVLETGDYDDMESPATAASIELLEGHGYRAYEDVGGTLQPHRHQDRYVYGNLFLVKAGPAGTGP